MMKKEMIVAGEKFGKLTVITPRVRMGKYFNRYALFYCECGTEKVMLAAPVKHGRVVSCGCYLREATRKRFLKHGMSELPIYGVWEGIKQRCQNPNSNNFSNYGGRGIKLCERWQSFENFVADVGNRPDCTEIDRINNYGDYEPGNCRWVTKMENANNRRTNKLIEFNGEIKSISEWSRDIGIAWSTLSYRIKNMPLNIAFKKEELHGKKRPR